MEKTRDFRGVYHVLMGALSPLHGVGPDDLKIKKLTVAMGPVKCGTMPTQCTRGHDLQHLRDAAHVRQRRACEVNVALFNERAEVRAGSPLFARRERHCRHEPQFRQLRAELPYLADFLECRNGKVWPNDRPGLGVTVDERRLTFVEAITVGAPGGSQRRPDGSLTHW